MDLAHEDQGGFFRRKGRIATREMLGSETLYKIDFPDGISIMVKSLEEGFGVGEEVCVSVDREELCFFDRSGQRIREGLDELLALAGGSN